MTKLEQLAEYEGYESVDKMIDTCIISSVVPAICMTEGCDYTTGMEPDQDAGWCEECGLNTVKSCLILMEII